MSAVVEHFLDETLEALEPYGYEYLLGVIGIPGPGNVVVTFASKGDIHTACVTHDYQVLWCVSCGGTQEGYTEEYWQALAPFRKEPS